MNYIDGILAKGRNPQAVNYSIGKKQTIFHQFCVYYIS